MSRDYTVYHFPEELKELFPNLYRLHIYKMPTKPRNIEKMLRVPDSTNVIAVGENGRVYITHGTRNSRLSFFHRNKWQRARIDRIKLLHRLGVITDKEMDIIESIDAYMEKLQDELYQVNSAISSLEKIDQPVPDNLVERKESLKEDIWWKKWLEHYNKNAEE